MEALKKIGNKYLRSEYIWAIIFMIVLRWLGFLNEVVILTLIAASFGSKGLTDFKKQETKKTNENQKDVIYSVPASGEYNSVGYRTKEEAKKEFRNISNN